MVQDPYWLTATLRGMILYHIYLTQLLQSFPKDTNNIAGEAEGLQKSQSSPCITWPDSLQSLSLHQFRLAVTQHHHDEGWAAHVPQFSFSSFQFPWQLPVLVQSLLSCLRPLFLGLPGCSASPILYYIKITLFFSHLHPVKLPHWLSPNKYSSSSLDLLNPPNKPASNLHPYWLLRWCLVSSAQAPSHRKHCTIFCFSYPHTCKIPYFPAKLCLRLSSAHFCVLTFPNLSELETVPDSLGVFPLSLFNIPAKEYKEGLYTQIQKEILRSWGNTRSSVWYLVSSQTVKQHTLAIHTETICFKISPRISSRQH